MKKIIACFALFILFFAIESAEIQPRLTGRIFIKLTDKCLKTGRNSCLKSLGCVDAGKLTLKNWALAKCSGDPVKRSEEFVKKGLISRPERFVKTELYSIDPLYLNDTYAQEQWNFHNTGNVTSADGKLSVKGNDHAHIFEAWQLLKTLGVVTDSEIGKERKIGIIDDGFDILHDDLKDNFISWKNFSGPVEPGNMFSETAGTVANFHGTMVAGVAAARGNNSAGLTGACPACSVIAARMDADPTIDPELTAEEYFDSIFNWVYEEGAEIINCSWGPDADINAEYFGELFSYFATNGRGGLGTLIVFASGNSGEDFSWNPFATHPDTLSVGATDSTGSRYDFSNYGTMLDIMAPTAGGEKSGTTKYFDRIWTTDNFLRPACLAEGAVPTNGCSDQAGWTPNHPMAGGDGWWGKYSYRFSHTSSAAPLVTGVAALLLEANQALIAKEIKEILINTADKVSPMDANYDSNGHSNKYGFGRINALRAVAAAWIFGGGTITAGLKDDIDESSPCTKEDCWNFEGAEYPDVETENDLNNQPDEDEDTEITDDTYFPDDVSFPDEDGGNNENNDADALTVPDNGNGENSETENVPDEKNDDLQYVPDELVEEEKAGCSVVRI